MEAVVDGSQYRSVPITRLKVWRNENTRSGLWKYERDYIKKPVQWSRGERCICRVSESLITSERDSITSTTRVRDGSVQTALIGCINTLIFKRISRDTDQHCWKEIDMKVVAIIMNAVSTLGLIVTAAIQIRAGYYSDEHPSLFTQFDSTQSDLAWICALLFFILSVLSLSMVIYFVEQAKRKSPNQ